MKKLALIKTAFMALTLSSVTAFAAQYPTLTIHVVNHTGAGINASKVGVTPGSIFPNGYPGGVINNNGSMDIVVEKTGNDFSGSYMFQPLGPINSQTQLIWYTENANALSSVSLDSHDFGNFLSVFSASGNNHATWNGKTDKMITYTLQAAS